MFKQTCRIAAILSFLIIIAFNIWVYVLAPDTASDVMPAQTEQEKMVEGMVSALNFNSFELVTGVSYLMAIIVGASSSVGLLIKSEQSKPSDRTIAGATLLAIVAIIIASII